MIFIIILPVLQPRLCLDIVGLGYSHFDRHYSGNHFCFLFLRVLRCFSSPGSLPDLRRDSKSSTWRVAPFGYLRIYRIFAPPRSFSQLVTSFIASESQGIHRLPLITFLSNLLLILQIQKFIKNLISSLKTSMSKNLFFAFRRKGLKDWRSFY